MTKQKAENVLARAGARRGEKQGSATGGASATKGARRKRGRKAIEDKAIVAALQGAGGVVGRAAETLGVTSRTVRRRTGPDAANPEMRGLPEKVRERVRELVQRNVLAALEEGDARMTLEILRSRVCEDLGFAPVATPVRLSGKVDGDVRVGPLDREQIDARLAALGVAQDPEREGGALA